MRATTSESPSPIASSDSQPHHFKIPKRMLLAVFLIAIAVLSVLLIFQFVPSAHAITRVQGNANGTDGGQVSFTITQSPAPTSGDVNVLVFGAYATDSSSSKYDVISSVTQTGVTWAQQTANSYGWTVTHKYFDVYFGIVVEIWYGVASGTTGTTITVTFSRYGDTDNYAVGDVCEYSGMATSSFKDKTATNQGNNYGDTGTIAATSQASELWIGGITVASGATAQSGATNSFSLLDGAVTSSTFSVGYYEYVASSTGAANTGETGVSARYCGCIATFKAAAGFSASITVNTTTHTWTISPGDNNVSINENSGYISLTVTASGANFDVGANASGVLTYGANTIALSNTNMSASTWSAAIALTTTMQTIPGLSNVAPGAGLTEKVYLWLSCPTNVPAGNYTETITFEIISHGGSY